MAGAFAAQAYLDAARMNAAGIEVLYHAWSPPTYAQVHPRAGFVPDLSVVDLLAAEGEAARTILERAGRIEPRPPGAAY